MRRLVLLRRASQLLFLAFFVYVLWSTTYPMKGGVDPHVLFKTDPLVMFATAVAERTLISGLEVAALMLVLAFVLGRFFCGWVCPMGTSIDIAGKLVRFLRRPFSQMPRLRKVKFALLAAIFASALFGLQLAWPFDPIVIAGRFVSLNLIPGAVNGAEKAVSWLVRTFGLYGYPLDLYRWLREGPLGVNAYLFRHAVVVLAVFLAVAGLASLHRRFWCRVLCPLGALYGLVARFALLKRTPSGCIRCGNCVPDCRMGAINDDSSYDAGECILCMDCVYTCKAGETRFRFRREPKPAPEPPSEEGRGLTRREFVALAAGSLAAVPAASTAAVAGKPAPGVIRPPGALPGSRFLDQCIRCGNCMKVCVTNGLQPAVLEAGMRGIWTPMLVPDIGYCQYNCNLCGTVCPVEAIRPLPLPEKHAFRLGTAHVDRSICYPWRDHEECLVCEEHCPVPTKAIKRVPVPGKGRRVMGPVVDEKLCIGCGICQNKCPQRPVRAIIVAPKGDAARA
jgi:polyferredoxin